jgi:tripartite-type tricarboxylate transporter receptor subunit TctC
MRYLAFLSVLVAALVGAAPAPRADDAKSYPQEAVRIIVPYAAGGGTDVIARLISARLQAMWGKPVLVVNQPGASGSIGTGEVARAKPDGLTLGFVINNFVVNPLLFKSLPYDSAKDFTPITLLAEYPYVFVVNADLDVRTVGDLVALAKRKPGQIAYGSSGNGSGSHLGTELFAAATGTELLHVPYKGSGQAIIDLTAGQIQLLLTDYGTAQQLAASKKARILALATKQRSPALPDVPTIAETFPNFEVIGWFGVIAPAGIPPALARRIQGDIAKVIADPEVRKRLDADALNAVASEPQKFADYLKEEFAKWQDVVKRTKIEPQ